MISENTKAVLLLTTYFNSKEVSQYKPLTENGYGYFACWLSQNGFKPLDLLNAEQFDRVLDLWDNPLSHTKPKKIVGFSRLDHTISDITYERLHALLNRGASLSIALDKWASAGIWIMDRQHPNYPKAIRAQLKHKCPAIFFGVGNMELLNKPAVGFVGSRGCTDEDTTATQAYVHAINDLGYQVVSGAAKGIDSESMLASLNNGHTAVGIVADSLFRASGSGQWRQALRNQQLALITPFYPEAGFSANNAMARNKYIYLLSQATVVVCSGEKGGTWSGAIENIKNGWVPLLVSAHANTLQAGNNALLSGKGVNKPLITPISVTVATINSALNIEHAEQAAPQTEAPEEKPTHQLQEPAKGLLSTPKQNEPVSNTQGDFFGSGVDDVQGLDFQHKSEPNPVTTESQNELRGTPEQTPKEESNPELQNTPDTKPLSTDISLSTEENLQASLDVNEAIAGMPVLTVFYKQLAELIKQDPTKQVSEDAISQHFPEFELISKTALAKWLKQLQELGLIVRPNAKKKVYALPAAK